MSFASTLPCPTDGSNSRGGSRTMTVPQSPSSASTVLDQPQRMQRRFSTGTSPNTSSSVQRRSSMVTSAQHKSPEVRTMQGSSSPSRTVRRVKASENGARSLLPEWNRNCPPRERACTSSNTSTPTSSPTDCLRRQTENMFSSTYPNSTFSNYPAPPRRLRNWNISLGTVLQILITMLVVFLVFDSKLKVRKAAAQLKQYRSEEANLVGKMERIEKRAENLHATLARLKEGDENFPLLSGSAAALSEPENASIRNDYSKWKKREVRLKEEASRMKKIIQDDAEAKIEVAFGADMVIYVDMELDVPELSENHRTMSMELFPAAPHATWVWLQQILNKDWDGATFTMNPSHILQATPATVDASAALEFVEEPEDSLPETWTVGLGKRTSGGLNFFINTSDNMSSHDEVSCIGKIVSGHRAIEHMMKLPKKDESGSLEEPVVIKTTRVTTVPRHFKRY